MQAVGEILCYFYIWISQTVYFFRNFHCFWSSRKISNFWKIEITKKLDKHFLLHIIETLCHIYKETIKNFVFNDSLWINFSGPQIIFLWDTSMKIIYNYLEWLFLLSITDFLCSLNKKTLITVVLLLVLKFWFWSVNFIRLTDPTQKLFWKYIRLFMHSLLSKFEVKITGGFKVMAL